MRKAALAAACVAVLAVSAAAVAQTPAPQEPQPANTYLLGRLSGGSTLERYLQTLRNEFTRMDADGNGAVDQSDIDLHIAMNSAAMRSMVALQIMRSDLDGDGAVTERELRQRTQYEWRSNGAMQRAAQPGVASPEERLEQEILKIMAADADKDGRITWNEAIEYSKKQPGYAQSIASGMAMNGREILALAPAGKSAVTLPEFEAAATAFFHSVDSDGNGTISLDELDSVRKVANRVAAEAARQRVQQGVSVVCDLPKASDAAKVALLGVYETEALSDVAIGSQDDVTGVGTVTIEPGEGPLYIVIASYRPTIWRFYGAVERVERVVVVSSRSIPGKNGGEARYAAGVAGLPADRISFPARAGCLNYFSEAPSIASAKAAGAVKQATGKDPAMVATKYKLTGISVPSGKMEVIDRNRPQVLVIEKSGGSLIVEGDASNIRVQTPNGSLERDLYMYNPGGVIKVDAAKVVANAPVEPYEVLPEQAGLIQLVNSGALTQNRSGEFLINQKIRFPAGLAGAHAVKFLLRRGVPEPDGDPGHSSVISEETGQPVQPHKS